MATELGKSNASKKPSFPTQEDDRLSRIINQLFQQLKPCLPIDSIEKIKKKLTEIELGDHRIPLNTFRPFLSEDLFPIKSEAELQKKLDDGVRRGVALIDSGIITVGEKLHSDVLATAIQASEAAIKPSVPVRKIFKF